MRRVLGLLALVATGCAVNIGFDPFGTAVSVAGAWTIDGMAADPARCEAAGIAFVRVRLYDGERHRDDSALVFECGAGAFDTRPERVLDEGVFTLGMVAIDADGQPVATQDSTEVDTVMLGSHIDLPPFDIATAP